MQQVANNQRKHDGLAGSSALLVVLALSACSPSTETPTADDPASSPPAKPDFTYALAGGDGNSGRQQTLQVFGLGDEEIDVAIEIRSPCERSVSGKAIASTEVGDMEVEVDSEGNGYPVDVFFLEPALDCFIEVRLEAGDRAIAWLEEVDCSSSCPISGDDMRLK